MINLKFRQLEQTDYSEFLSLIQQFRATNFTEDQYKYQLQEINKCSEIWVVIYEDKIVATGTIIFEHKFIFNLSKLAHIEDVCVDEKYRSKGIGKKLVLFLRQRAKEMNCYKVVLDCGQHNIEFYTKCGLEQRGVQMSQLV